MKSNWFVLLLIMILYSCEPGVVFDEPNPPSTPSIDQIPEGFYGRYLCESDSSLMWIKSRLIAHESNYEIRTTLEKVSESENCSVVDGGIHISGRKECFPFDYISEDSISARIYYLDTLFSFQSKEVAKYYKGQLYINILNEKGNWITWILRPDNYGNLEFFLIKIPAEKESIEEITDNYETRRLDRDKIQYIIKPTLVQFEELINREYTLLCETLIPISAETTIPEVRDKIQ